MASMIATRRPPREGFGQKVKNMVEMVGTIKGIYDTGRTIYNVAKVAGPVLGLL